MYVFYLRSKSIKWTLAFYDINLTCCFLEFVIFYDFGNIVSSEVSACSLWGKMKQIKAELSSTKEPAYQESEVVCQFAGTCYWQ